MVVALLLAHGAEPGLRNVRGESPLDLAAQYGRLDSVALLVGAQAHSLQRLATAHHSPLHLAARNGHRQVVRLLLDRGFPVNCRTDNGTALHEAATFGKLDVVRLLLDYGVDVDLRDAQNRRATDVLEELNTGIAKQARDMIRGERAARRRMRVPASRALASDWLMSCVTACASKKHHTYFAVRTSCGPAKTRGPDLKCIHVAMESSR
ncbi:hypothetical protein HPB49_025781 [Dermacentor silvarum]|nr:hypothetical protein HPB49_025781 [Dermacentor silvarum]